MTRKASPLRDGRKRVLFVGVESGCSLLSSLDGTPSCLDEVNPALKTLGYFQNNEELDRYAHESPGRHGVGVGSGNANVEPGDAPGVVEAGGVVVGAGVGVGVGVGLGNGGIIFSQW
jgi:hypothetical protein